MVKFRYSRQTSALAFGAKQLLLRLLSNRLAFRILLNAVGSLQGRRTGTISSLVAIGFGYPR